MIQLRPLKKSLQLAWPSFYPTTTETWEWGQEWAKVTVLLMNILLLQEYHSPVSSRPSQNYVWIMRTQSDCAGHPKEHLSWVHKTLLLMSLVLFPVSMILWDSFAVRVFLTGNFNRFQSLHTLKKQPYIRTALENSSRNGCMQPRPVSQFKIIKQTKHLSQKIFFFFFFFQNAF